MQTKFKDIAQYYLGTGLEFKDDRVGFGKVYELKFSNISMVLENIKAFDNVKPILRSLDSLTKPITVKGYNDGKEFVPYKHLGWGNGTQVIPTILAGKINVCSFKLLLSWHFNIFGLEETEYIKID